ncbi:MAG: RhuM family protein [Nitrospiria bacterium]
MKAKSQISIYQSSDGSVRLEVSLDGATVWLTQKQIAELFDKERSVITKHINNVFKEGELNEKSNVQKMHIANSDRPVTFYNLDVIISVGYRVKSQRGVQFRQWATRVLRQHLVEGYSLNEKRLAQRGIEMVQAVALLSSTLSDNRLVNDEGVAVLALIRNYARSWHLLQAYDEQSLKKLTRSNSKMAELTIDEAMTAITKLKADLLKKGEATDLFGQLRGDGLASALGSTEQTFSGRALYPNIPSRAAHLLYFVIKNHPFTDGNKRIASFLFLLY